MTKPYVIAVNGLAGAGKTTLATLLRDALSATLFCFDDFDDTNVHPPDMYAWWDRGANLSEFDSPGMLKAVEKAFADNAARYMVLDYPFGRDHPNFKSIIDFSIFVDTPMDIALARRILRDYAAPPPDTDTRLANCLDVVEHYLKGRHIYFDTYRHKLDCDLILDGYRTPQELMDEVLTRLRCE